MSLSQDGLFPGLGGGTGLGGIGLGGIGGLGGGGVGLGGDLLSVQEARILMENAGEARKVLAGFEQERLDRIVVHMAQAAAKHARELAVMSCEETEYGNWQDKYRKNRYICEYLPEKLI